MDYEYQRRNRTQAGTGNRTSGTRTETNATKKQTEKKNKEIISHFRKPIKYIERKDMKSLPKLNHMVVNHPNNERKEKPYPYRYVNGGQGGKIPRIFRPQGIRRNK